MRETLRFRLQGTHLLGFSLALPPFGFCTLRSLRSLMALARFGFRLPALDLFKLGAKPFFLLGLRLETRVPFFLSSEPARLRFPAFVLFGLCLTLAQLLCLGPQLFNLRGLCLKSPLLFPLCLPPPLLNQFELFSLVIDLGLAPVQLVGVSLTLAYLLDLRLEATLLLLLPQSRPLQTRRHRDRVMATGMIAGGSSGVN
jgi:hypothetical protein